MSEAQNSPESGKTAALRKLLEDDELRQKFVADPKSVLQSLGLELTDLDEADLEDLGLEVGSGQLEQRRSKSAWFGGNPFG